jgi:beta-glucosidase
VLFGDYDPAGRLTTTWPKSLDQLPPMMDYNIRDGRTYMYFKGEPLYPFGFGLSYTTFKLANLRTNAPRVTRDGTVTVSVDVTNTGSVRGDDVVQLYVKHMGSKVARPGEELEGFKRVSVEAGTTKTVEIPLKASQLAYWDEKAGGFKVEAEPVNLMIGNSAKEILLTTTVQVQ